MKLVKPSRKQVMEFIKGKSLSSRMWLMVVVILFVIGVAFTITTVILTSSARRDYEIRESETIINGVSESIRSNMDNYRDLSRLVMLNDEVAKFLRVTATDKGIANDAKTGILNVLNVCRNVDSVYIIRNDGSYTTTGKGEYIFDNNLIRGEEWQSEILKERGGVVYGMEANGAVFKKNGTRIITIARAIYDIYTQKQTGILLMNISQQMLDRTITTSEQSDVCILDRDGSFLAGNDSMAAYFDKNIPVNTMTHDERFKGIKRIMVSQYATEDFPLVIICATTANADAVPYQTMVTLAFLLIFILIALFFASSYLTKNVTRPILNLSSAMQQTEQKGWMEKFEVEMPENEIGMLAHSYNSMIDYLNDLFTELLDKEKSVQKAEMQILQEQIKPHFLYNSLETISFMALDYGDSEVYTALETLGSFYRNFLSKGDRDITLRREVNIVRDYIALQKLRYKDILTDEYEIEDNTLECRVPKLILQPIVENSIYHGIRLKGEPGVISIKSFIEEDVLHISIKDTGIGMPQERIEKILSPKVEDVEDKDLGNHSNFGLKGTINRVRYYFDSQDIVHIESVEGEYTIVEFLIPLNRVGRELQDDV